MTVLFCHRHLFQIRSWSTWRLCRDFSRNSQPFSCTEKSIVNACSSPLPSRTQPGAITGVTSSFPRVPFTKSFSSIQSKPSSKLFLDALKSVLSSKQNKRSFSTLRKEDSESKTLLKNSESFSPVLNEPSLPPEQQTCVKRKCFSTLKKDDSLSKTLLDHAKTISQASKQPSLSTKQQENVEQNVGEQSKVKLQEGDVALVLRENEGDSSGGLKVERYNLEDIQKKYNALTHILTNTSARGYLHNFGQSYKSVVGKEIELKYHFSRCPKASSTTKKTKGPPESQWSCLMKLKIPFSIEIRGVGRNKAEAGDAVAKLMIHELYARKIINIKGKPLGTTEKKKSAVVRPANSPVCAIDDLMNMCSVDTLNSVTHQYDKTILPLIEAFEQEEHERQEEERRAAEVKALESESSSTNSSLIDSDLEQYVRPVNSKMEQQRNRQLERKATTLIERAKASLEAGKRKKLPIEDYRQDIVDTIASNRITIIKGEPGCGKSTQVAQMILNDASLKGQGTHCNIFITQPRRISAISLAKRVASERQELVGDSVGYHVRLQHIFPRHAGHIQFVTTGILLSRLQSQQGLDHVSHIILDEAHERDISTDLLLLLTKRLLEDRPGLKLLVMSATLNAEMFQKYFESAPVLHIPGFTHPVQRHYLSTENCKEWKLCAKEEDRMNLVTSREPSTNPSVICNLILWIHRNKPEGAILCFLPGWQDIQQVSRTLQSSPVSSALYITMAHSKLDAEIQGAIFGHPPPGIRKVVLSTNVAETSITIDDVSYVVDTGCHKEKRYDAKDDLVSLDNHWISRASVNQRAGRAGRTKPGESFHLYTEDRFRKMAEYSLPEIFRTPLEQVLLTCKLYGNERSEDFLSQLPEPPDTLSVQAAVTELKHMGVFDQLENLTALGKRIAAMQCHPKLSSALVHSVVYKCALPIGNIVTLLSTPERPLFENSLLNTSKDAIRDIKSNLSRYSDHIAGSKLMNDWGSNSARRGNVHEYLHERNLRHLYDVRDQLMNGLYANRLLDEDTDWLALTSGRGLFQSAQNINRMAHIDEFVRSVLYAGVQNLLISRTAKGKRRLCTEQGQICTIVKESVNSNLKSSPTPLLVYYDATTSLARRITSVRDSSVVSPLTVLLFRRGSATILSKKDAARIKPDLNEETCIVSLQDEDRMCNIVVPVESQALLLLRLRAILSRLSLFFISHQGHPLSSENLEHYQRIDRYWNQVLDTVTPLFEHYTSYIDEYRNENEVDR